MTRFGTSQYKESQERLFTYLKSGRVHSTLLLSGPDKAAKSRIALNATKLFLCQYKGETFCDKCSACSRVERGIHPDVLVAQEETPGETIKVESVRTWSHQMELSPVEGETKHCIIEECHRLTTASANAFLKSLEEPRPGRFYWLLSTKPRSLLPTMLSRCLEFHFRGEEAEIELLVEKEAEFKELMNNYQLQRLSGLLTQELSDRQDAGQFLKYIQKKLSENIKNNTNYFLCLDSEKSLSAFEKAVLVEEQLRSNANHVLLIQNYLENTLLHDIAH